MVSLRFLSFLPAAFCLSCRRLRSPLERYPLSFPPAPEHRYFPLTPRPSLLLEAGAIHH